jgi:AraC family transcriptional regulator
MTSSDNTLEPHSSRLDAARELGDDQPISGLDDSDMLASLLATATVALHSDRRVTQQCVQHAAALLGIDLRSVSVFMPGHSYRRSGLAPRQAERLRAYIDDRLDSPIRAGDLAGLVRLSPSHFFRAFRKTFGESPLAYVTTRRMLRAQDLMLASHLSLAQVALECGMCDQAHFSRTFRRVIGINPATWRRRFTSAPHPAMQPRRERPKERKEFASGRGLETPA